MILYSMSLKLNPRFAAPRWSRSLVWAGRAHGACAGDSLSLSLSPLPPLSLSLSLLSLLASTFGFVNRASLGEDLRKTDSLNKDVFNKDE